MASGSQARTAFVLGLTGPIACGKTAVGDVLLRLGAVERIDADQVVHRLLAPGTETSQQVRRAFGPEVMAADGGVDRPRLAACVFGSPQELQRLEAIVHPAVRQWVHERMETLAAQRGVVVLDAVKLLQSELLDLCDAVWVVRCTREAQRQRLLGNRGMSEEQAVGRLAAQPTFDHSRVSVVIDNSGSRADLETRVREEWLKLSPNR